MSQVIVELNEEKNRSLKNLTQIVYVLYALSYFAGLTAIVGIIINYVKLEDVSGTWRKAIFAGRSAPSGSVCCGP